MEPEKTWTVWALPKTDQRETVDMFYPLWKYSYSNV